MSESESSIQAKILLAHGATPGVRLFRNTVGEGWMGEPVSRSAENITLRNYRRVTFGLHPGSPDLVGVRSVVVTEQMIGTTLGQFVGLEVKKPGGPTALRQRDFLRWLLSFGALAGVVRSSFETATLFEKPLGETR